MGEIVNKSIKNRIYKEVELILKEENTIRELANVFSVSKSTIHKDLSERLYELSQEKYYKVKKIFDKHIEQRHINGGESTRMKYICEKGGKNERYWDRFRYS